MAPPQDSEFYSSVSPLVKTIGHCIYCGPTNTTGLTREHVFPHGMGGGLILLKASCARHSEVTAKFEGDFLGRDIAPFRQTYGLPSRRPKRATFPLTIDHGTHKELKEVPAEDHPSMLSLPVFKNLPGGYRTGQVGPVEVQAFRVYRSESKFREAIKEHGAPNAGVQISFALHSFIKLLAKVAHGVTVAEFGCDFEPTLIELIEGHGIEEAGYLVGNSPAELEMNPASHAYRYRIFGFGDLNVIGIDLRFFVSGDKMLPTPTYSVVSGLLERNKHPRWQNPRTMGLMASTSARE
jgi:hypothetical protein